ncbi:MAG: YceI family protein [Actinobacteria bacterium]|nr:YceI family protein [Actinomycetota bacterium]
MALDSTLDGDYTIDPSHTSLGFVARHAMVTKVRGKFVDVTGTGHLDAADPTRSSLHVVAKVASVTTGVDQRDEHLRTNDFFDAPTYPDITFTSTKIDVVDDTNFTVTGNLTIKETTRPITFDLELTGPVQDPWGNTRIGLEGSVVVNRKDWGVNWNTTLEAGGVLVSEKVTLSLDVSATKNA